MKLIYRFFLLIFSVKHVFDARSLNNNVRSIGKHKHHSRHHSNDHTHEQSREFLESRLLWCDNSGNEACKIIKKVALLDANYDCSSKYFEIGFKLHTLDLNNVSTEKSIRGFIPLLEDSSLYSLQNDEMLKSNEHEDHCRKIKKYYFFS